MNSIRIGAPVSSHRGPDARANGHRQPGRACHRSRRRGCCRRAGRSQESPERRRAHDANQRSGLLQPGLPPHRLLRRHRDREGLRRCFGARERRLPEQEHDPESERPGFGGHYFGHSRGGRADHRRHHRPDPAQHRRLDGPRTAHRRPRLPQSPQPVPRASRPIRAPGRTTSLSRAAAPSPSTGPAPAARPSSPTASATTTTTRTRTARPSTSRP